MSPLWKPSLGSMARAYHTRGRMSLGMPTVNHDASREHRRESRRWWAPEPTRLQLLRELRDEVEALRLDCSRERRREGQLVFAAAESWPPDLLDPDAVACTPSLE